MEQTENWFWHVAGQARASELAMMLAIATATKRRAHSITELARLAGMSRRRAIDVIGDLEFKGWIAKDSGKALSPTARNEYTITAGRNAA